MNKKKIMLVTSFTILIVIIICILVGKNIRIYTPNIPNENEIYNIEFIDKGNSFIIDEKEVINRLMKALKKKKTIISGTQDVPVNAKSYTIVNIKTEKETVVMYLYEKKESFYLEQPYNGIYKIDKTKLLRKEK